METTPDINAPLPALKAAIEAVPFEHEGKPMVMLRDMEGVNENAMAVSPPAFLLALLLNGQNTVSQVQTLFTQNTGQVLQPQEILNIVKELDKGDLIENEKLAGKRREILRQFLDNPVRKAMHVDTGYPRQPMDLATFLGKFFQDPKGPKKQLISNPTQPTPLGLVSPHIDFHRGGPAYAWAYQALSECAPPDLIVGLGVAHMSPNSPWVLSHKSYETPYGPMPVSGDLYKDVASTLWYNPTEDEWAHRTEHSLEFQALWLKYLWRDKTPPWVPILCSDFSRFSGEKAPSSIPTIEKAIVELGEKLKARQKAGQKILILAGIDLAHVGPRFGDELKLGPDLEKRVEEEDRKSIDHALRLDADTFYLSVVADGHWRQVCGLSALYTALRLMAILSGRPASPEPVGKLLAYGQAPDPMGGLVSFTSAIFPSKS